MMAPLLVEDATGEHDWLSLEPTVVPVAFPVAEADVDVADVKSLTPTEGAIWTKCEPVSLVQILVPIGPHHQF